MEQNVLEKLNQKKALLDKLKNHNLVASTRLKDYRASYAKERDALCELCGITTKDEKEIEKCIQSEEATLANMLQELEKTIPDNVLEKFAAIDPDELEDERALQDLDLSQDF